MNWLDVKRLEPRIDEVLADPIVRLMMAKDGISEYALRAHLQDASLRWQNVEACRCAPERGAQHAG